MSIKVSARLDEYDSALEQVPVRITIQAPLADLQAYYKNVSPSYAVGHRLHEVIGELLAQLNRQGVEVEQ